MKPLAVAIWLAAWAVAPAQDFAAVVRDAARDDADRAAALLRLHENGPVPVEVFGVALRAGGALQAAAVAVLRHATVDWPDALLATIDADPAATEAVLRELAIAPRPAAAAWVARVADDSVRPLPLQLLALAARAEPPDRDDGERILRGLVAGERDAASLAAAHLPPAVADALVGKAHAALQGDLRPEELRPLFERLSPRGMTQLLGLVGVLPDDKAAALCDVLAAHENAPYRERVRAAVDGEIPLEEHWLLRAGPLLTTPARRDRVAAVLADADASPAMRLRAFEALLDAGVFVPPMAAFAVEVQQDGPPDPDRVRRLLLAAPQGLPEAIVLDALRAGGDVAMAAVRAQQHAIAPAVERELLRLLDDGAAGDGRPPDARLQRAAFDALVRHGSDHGVQRALAAVRDQEELLLQGYDTLGGRKDPIASAALLAELAPSPPAPLADALHLALAECGDLRTLADLVAAAPSRSPSFVRRCRHVMPHLREPLALRVLDGCARTTDAGVQVELVLWAGGTPSAAVQERVERMWRRADDDEVREAALHVLMAGGKRAELVQQWRRGALDDDPLGDLVLGEAVATLPSPLDAGGAALLQFVLFDEPRRDPAAEQTRAARFPDGRTGFPMVGAVAHRLRQEPASLDAVLAPADELARLGDTAHLSRQRFLFLLTALQAQPELRERAGRLLARLVLAIDDAQHAGEGVANHYLAAALGEAGDHAAAAVAARLAVRQLSCDPTQRMHARIHLGVRDPQAGVDPYAALAAAPALHEALAAQARGDRAATATAARVAAEFAGRDAATLERIADLVTWSRR